jgi:2-C-methyl-D-erythritol 4-phosphate cytidylyltransferase
MDAIDKYAIIVAGGSGSRMGSKIPKQFLQLGSKPILMHTLHAFAEAEELKELIVVLPKEFHNYWRELCHQFDFTESHLLVEGGETRFHSVRNGLCMIAGESGLVAVHDAVRPFVGADLLHKCFHTAWEHGSGVAAVQLKDSIRMRKPSGDSTAMNRTDFMTVQTPQVFRINVLKEAFRQKYIPEFTDDATVVEKAGFPIVLVEGHYRNIKITTPEDIELAEKWLMNKHI